MKRSAVILLLTAVLWAALAPPLRAAAGVKCSYCSKSIVGKYYTFDLKKKKKLIICAACLKKSPRCTLCTVPIQRPKNWDGRSEIFCPTCYRDRKVCSVCSVTIKGKFFKSGNTNDIFCLKCNTRAEKCDNCRKPLKKKEAVAVRGQSICAYCDKTLPRCSSCGLQIVKTRITYKFADGVFCQYCVDEYVHCYVCGIPVKGRRMELSDDRYMCPSCAQTAILTTIPLRRIDRKVSKFLRDEFDMNVKRQYEIKLVRSRKYLGGKDHEVEGNEQGLFRMVGGESFILVLEGVTEAMAYETMAHEYAHAWHAENGMQYADSEIREGFSQWCASKALEYFGYENGLKRLRARTDQDYGTGYQKFAAIEKVSGVERVFIFLLAASRKK